MTPSDHCPDCGTPQTNGTTCEDHFHQMLYWEAEDAALGMVHHLMVLGFHLQHPSRYSPEGLRYGIKLLDAFVREGISTHQARRRGREMLDSGSRDWNVTNKGVPGAYDRPIRWTMTAADVVTRGRDEYIEAVQGWARAIYADLQREGYV